MKQTVLVTGGAGYVGSHTVWALRDQGIPVVVYDDLSTGVAALCGDTPLVVGQLEDRDRLAATFRDHAVHAIIHFAARAVVPESVAQPLAYWRNNVAGTLALLETAMQAGVSRLVFSSTAGVYGADPAGPLLEDRAVAPHHPYGRTKHAVEQLLDDCGRAGLLAAVALRYFNAAGGDTWGRCGELHRPETHLIPKLFEAATGESGPFTLCGADYSTRDGSPERDYIHVADLARAHLAALDYLARQPPGPLTLCNLGSGRGYTVQEVLTRAEQVLGRPIPWQLGPRRPGDPARLVAEIDRARTLLGWEPCHSDLHTILTSAWRWHGSALRREWLLRGTRNEE